MRSVTSTTSSWFNSSCKPAAKLEIHEIPRTFKSECAATITSGTVDIPTASAPNDLKARISAGVS